MSASVLPTLPPVAWVYTCPVLGCRNMLRPTSPPREFCAAHTNGFLLLRLIESPTFYFGAMCRRFLRLPRGEA